MKNDTGVSGTLIDLIIHFISSCSEHLWLASLSLIRGTTVDWFSCFFFFSPIRPIPSVQQPIPAAVLPA